MFEFVVFLIFQIFILYFTELFCVQKRASFKYIVIHKIYYWNFKVQHLIVYVCVWGRQGVKKPKKFIIGKFVCVCLFLNEIWRNLNFALCLGCPLFTYFVVYREKERNNNFSRRGWLRSRRHGSEEWGKRGGI